MSPSSQPWTLEMGTYLPLEKVGHLEIERRKLDACSLHLELRI